MPISELEGLRGDGFFPYRDLVAVCRDGSHHRALAIVAAAALPTFPQLRKVSMSALWNVSFYSNEETHMKLMIKLIATTHSLRRGSNDLNSS